MASEEALRLFSEGNRFWFENGLTYEALIRYRAVVKRDPTDPVALFQLAHVLWALSRFEEAREALDSAQRHPERLSTMGQRLLAREGTRMLNVPSFRSPSPVAERDLDMERLMEKGLSTDQWLDIAFAAREREMYGLAIHAFGYGSSFQALEIEEDQRAMERESRNAINVLYVMRPEAERALMEEIARDTTDSCHQDLPESPAFEEVMLDIHPDPRVVLHPLSIEVGTEFGKSVIGQPLSLQVTLTNTGIRPLAVNTRLLLNHPESPAEHGEIYLSVEGPPDYTNLVAYSVRAGRPGAEHFDLLMPTERIGRSYALNEFESLHLPGTYRLWVTYRNVIRETVKGIPLYVGSLSSLPIAITRVNE